MLLIAIQILLLWTTFTHCQWYGYTGTCSDPYSQYAYSQSAYSPYGAYGYPSYPVSGYDYQSYSSYPEATQQPIVVVVDDDDDDDDDDDEWDWLNLVSTIATLKGYNGGNNGPVYIPYPIPIPYGNNDFESDWDRDTSSCYGCRNKGCTCKNDDSSYYDYECNCDSCRDTGKKRRIKCRSGNGCSNSDCDCHRCGSIKHKCGRCKI